MTIYLVTVIVGDSINARYFDSMWVVKEHCDARVIQLRDEFRRAGIAVESDGSVSISKRWTVKAVQAEATDGQLADEPLAQARRLPSAAGKEK